MPRNDNQKRQDYLNKKDQRKPISRKKDPEYTDYKYWKEQGWIDTVRPWQ